MDALQSADGRNFCCTAGTLLGLSIALVGGIIVYGGLKEFSGIRLNAEEQYMSADLAIHKISSTPTAAAGDD